MSTTIARQVHFEAAHHLPNAPDGHKCRRLHGHSYSVEIHVTGSVDETTGWVCDFGELAKAFAPLRELLDHRTLNDVEGLENPTSENLARWIWTRLAGKLAGLSGVVISETCTSKCIFTGP
ncbi:6-carboxytetrahydropterin synthase QueD [Myxococcota bacterium]